MGKILSILVVLLVMSSSTFSNEYGLKIGLNYSGISGKINNEYNFKYKFGASFGLFYIIQLSPNLKVQPEFLLNQRGFQSNNTSVDGFGNKSSYDYREVFNYIDLSTVFKYRVFYDNNLTLNLNSGPNISLFYSGKWYKDWKYYKEEGNLKNVSKFNSGLIIGSDLSFNRHFIFDVRYIYSFTSVYKIIDWDLAHHSFYSVSVAFLLSEIL